MTALIGVVMLGVAARPVWQWARTRDWVETPATLISVSLSNKQNRERTLSWKKVTAEYKYVYGGVERTGSQVLLNDGQLDLRSRQKFTELRAAKRAGDPVVCYVNPRHTSEAVLDRRFCFEQCLIWLSVACFVLGFPLVIRGNQAKWRGGIDPELEAAHPDEPWRWNREWLDGRLRTEGRRYLGESIGGVMILGGVTSALATLALFHRASTPVLVALAICGGLFAYVLVLTARTLTRRIRFGESMLRLGGATGVVGGRLTGEVEAPPKLLDAEELTLRLYCVVTRIARGSEGDTERENVVWEREQPAIVRRGANGAIVPVDFVVPSSAPPTKREEKRLATWRLSLAAKLPGPDYRESFLVPVFETPDSQPGVTVEKPPAPTHTIEAAFDDTTPLDQRLTCEGIQVETLGGGGVRYFAPAGRSRRGALELLLWAIGWNGVLGGIGYAVYAYGGWGETIFFIVAACALWVLVLLGPLLIFAALDAWLGSAELTIDGNRWTTRIGWWGLPKWRTEFLAGNLRKIVVKHSSGSSVRVGNGPKKQSVGESDLVAQVAGANLPRMLLRRIKSRQTAEMLAEELRRQAGDGVEMDIAEGFAEMKSRLRGEEDGEED